MDHPPILQLFEVPHKQEEYREIEKQFKAKFSCLPSFYVRVPGRVNLIGEHIDYCGFSVFPMAIEQDIVLAVGVNNDKLLNLSNLETDLYSDFSSPIDSLKISQSSPKWYHYFMCGLQGISEECHITSKGLDVVAYGTIPPSSGLSSSSALVCAAALATAYANRVTLTKMNIANICAKCERYIGTQGGGMDQAIAFLAETGSAKLIEFNPLKAFNIPLPEGANFVVANSCVSMNKAATSHFNTRVTECRLAAKVLAKAYGLDLEKVQKLGDIPSHLHCSLNDLVIEVRKILHEEPYTRAEICHLLDISENELETLYCSRNTHAVKEFKLYQRSLHVYEEASRVHMFKEVCESASYDALCKLGELMNSSHRSCRDLYECSHPELDELVEVALRAGALGSRLTGAGWGGCCVSLVSSDNIARFLEEVKNKFYCKTADRMKMMKTSLFVTQPGGGAVIYTT